MTDKELADRVVALGVGKINLVGDYQLGMHGGETPYHFVRDPRVALPLMERCWSVEFNINADGLYEAAAWKVRGAYMHTAINEGLPRAIVEACVMALEAS